MAMLKCGMPSISMVHRFDTTDASTIQDSSLRNADFTVRCVYDGIHHGPEVLQGSIQLHVMSGGEDQSAIAIKSHIKQLIDDEDPNKPLSDNKLMALLEEKEINVARRTIAKYREAMHIPSSSERKKLNKFK